MFRVALTSTLARVSRQCIDDSHVRRSPTGASFVRPDKVVVGKTVAAAIRERYAAEGQDVHLSLRDAHNRSMNVETVGFAKVAAQMSQLDRLRDIVLRDAPVAWAGPDGELSALVPLAASLDLSHTLVGDWATLDAILQQLPGLRTVRFDANYLGTITSPPNSNQLRELSLNKTLLAWPDVRDHVPMRCWLALSLKFFLFIAPKC